MRSTSRAIGVSDWITSTANHKVSFEKSIKNLSIINKADMKIRFNYEEGFKLIPANAGISPTFLVRSFEIEDEGVPFIYYGEV